MEKVKFIKLEPGASIVQLEEPVPLTKSSYLVNRLLQLAEVMEPLDESTIQLEVLQKANADLQAQLEYYKAQLETVTTQYGEEKTKWASLLHVSNQKVLTGKVASRAQSQKSPTWSCSCKWPIAILPKSKRFLFTQLEA